MSRIILLLLPFGLNANLTKDSLKRTEPGGTPATSLLYIAVEF